MNDSAEKTAATPHNSSFNTDHAMWTTSARASLLAETARAYGAIWKGRSFIHFFAQCKRRAGLSRTLFKNVWIIAEPLSQMLIYYFLVVIVFRARDHDTGINPFVFIMLGIVHYLAFQQIILNGMRSVVNNEKLLMQITIEPLVLFGAVFYQGVRQFLLSLVIYCGFFIWLGPGASPRLLAYPIIFGLLLFIAWNLSVLLGALVVFLRDLENVMRILMRLLMYLSPVIYMVTFVPEELRGWYLCNPIAYLFALLQWCLLGQPFPGIMPIIVFGVFVAGLTVVAHVAYIRLRPKFTKAF